MVFTLPGEPLPCLPTLVAHASLLGIPRSVRHLSLSLSLFFSFSPCAGLAYCRHLSTVRTHLSALVNHYIVSPDVPCDASLGLTVDIWGMFLQDSTVWGHIPLGGRLPSAQFTVAVPLALGGGRVLCALFCERNGRKQSLLRGLFKESVF